jgi:hypothetical protein
MATDNLLILHGDVVDITVSEAPSITLAVATPPANNLDLLLVTGASGGGSMFLDTVPAEQQDGTTVVFALPRTAALPGQVQVFRNGLAEVNGLTFTATTTAITFSTAPLRSDIVVALYAL